MGSKDIIQPLNKHVESTDSKEKQFFFFEISVHDYQSIMMFELTS